MKATKSFALAAVIVLAMGLVTASAARADPTYDYVSYTDAQGDSEQAVDVVYTEASRNLYRGRLTFIVEGREFLKNESDFFRIYIDTNQDNSGPEYRYSWYPGKNPVARVGTKYLFKTDSWESEGRKVRCATRQKINYATDKVTIQIPNSCFGDTSGPIKWAGAVGRITRTLSNGRFTGDFDYFPSKNRFPGGDAL